MIPIYDKRKSTKVALIGKRVNITNTLYKGYVNTGIGEQIPDINSYETFPVMCLPNVQYLSTTTVPFLQQAILEAQDCPHPTEASSSNQTPEAMEVNNTSSENGRNVSGETVTVKSSSQVNQSSTEAEVKTLIRPIP